MPITTSNPIPLPPTTTTNARCAFPRSIVGQQKVDNRTTQKCQRKKRGCWPPQTVPPPNGTPKMPSSSRLMGTNRSHQLLLLGGRHRRRCRLGCLRSGLCRTGRRRPCSHTTTRSVISLRSAFIINFNLNFGIHGDREELKVKNSC